MFKFRHKSGFTLIEALIYIAVLVVVLSAVIGFIITMIKALDELRIEREINRSAQITLERMTREIRKAETINLSDSVFDSNPGQLSLTSAGQTYIFSVVNGDLVLTETGCLAETLLTSNVSVSSLIFRQVVGTESEGIKIELSLIHQKNQAKIFNFYATATLR